jgi:hypothetical protein
MPWTTDSAITGRWSGKFTSLEMLEVRKERAVNSEPGSELESIEVLVESSDDVEVAGMLGRQL